MNIVLLGTGTGTQAIAPTLAAAGHRISQVFLAGDDAAAKTQVTVLLTDLGWPADDIVDLGGIEHARGPEHLFLLLASLFRHLLTYQMNVLLIPSWAESPV